MIAMNPEPRGNPFRPFRKPVDGVSWQLAADLAQFLLAIELGRKWGLIDEEGRVNTDRCEQLLIEARDRLKIEPRSFWKQT